MAAFRRVKSKDDLLVKEEGADFDYRVRAFEKTASSQISLWHDIPLYPFAKSRQDRVVNMVNEIPKCSRKKYEIATKEACNPIKQDVKDGALREFKKGDLYFNYGCLPRTWENPDHEHPDAKACGDNDPLDVCEIGMKILSVGEVCSVKILGVLCLIDEGEADWKLIAISTHDPWCDLLNDVGDLESKLPGMVNAVREWFRTYKMADGKPENKFGLEGKCMGADYAMSIIDDCHQEWRKLVLSGDGDETLREEGSTSLGGGIKRNLSFPKLNLEDLIDGGQ